jgi:hypothetical protein
VSCDDWLDKTPKDRLYPDVYFKTEDELRLFTNQFYNNLVPSAVDIYSESSDLIVKSDLMLEMSGQRIIPDEGNGWNFTALRDINFYLQYSHNCTEVNARNRYDGVARFFRAYFYFEKVKRYGEIHFLPYHTYGMHKYHLLGLDYECARKPFDRPELLAFAEQQAKACGLTAILRG